MRQQTVKPMKFKIRNYSPFDNAKVHDMIRNFQASIRTINDYGYSYNPNRLDEILQSCRASNGLGGICLIAETDYKEVIGLLLAIKLPNIWNPQIHLMHELAFWIEPNFRGGRLAYELIDTYTNHCLNLQATKHISSFTIISMEDSELDYSHFGFKKWQEEWIQ